MEGSQKMNGKKKLLSIPSNYVTLLQLQERWNKEKERKEKGKEEKQEPQQQKQEEKEKENESNVEESVNDEVPGRGSRKNQQFKRDNGKRVAEGKPRDEKTAAVAEDLDNEKKGEELKKKKKNDLWKKSKEKKRNEKKEKARAANDGENTGNAPLHASTERDKGDEELIGDEVHAQKLASVEEENAEARREPRRKSIPRTYRRKAEIERKFQETDRNKGEKELVGNEVHAPKLASVEEEDVEARKEWKPRLNPRTHGRKAETGRKFQATDRSKGEEELIGDEVHAPKLASVEEESVEARRESRPRLTTRTHGRKAEIGRKFQAMERSKREEELTGVKVHAPMLASVEEENVEARRESESQPRFNPKTHGRKAEIGLEFEAMSVNGGMRKGGNRRYGRQHFNFNQRRGGNWEVNRRRDVNRINERMVWVKKGEVEDQNVN